MTNSRDEVLRDLREETRQRRPMIPKTIRLPERILDEIAEFLSHTHGIDQSVVLRRCVLIGWVNLKQVIGHERPGSR